MTFKSVGESDPKPNLLRACFESLAYICVLEMHKNPPLEMALVGQGGPCRAVTGYWNMEAALLASHHHLVLDHYCHTFDKSHLALRGFCHQHLTEL